MRTKLSKLKISVLSIVMALCVILSASVINSVITVADEGTTGGEGTITEEDLKRIVLDKKVKSKDEDNGIYTLTIDTYATGDIRIEQSTEVLPADILMILDTSSSMTSNKMGNERNSPTRFDVLKESATSFLQNLAANAPDGENNHRVSIVSFNQSATVETSKLSGADSSFVSLLNKGDLNSSLTDVIKNLSASPYTRTDLGFQSGYDAIKNRKVTTYTDSDNKTQKRPVAVLFFTDGFPSAAGDSGQPSETAFTNSSFVTANAAITTADKIKSEFDASIYTIGIASASGIGPDKSYNFSVTKSGRTTVTYSLSTGPQGMNAMMHFLSSDYDVIGGSTGDNSPMLTPNRTKVVNNGYYKTAQTASDLLEAFETISKTIVKRLTVQKVTKEAVVRDILSNYFEMPEGADIDDIKVYAVNVKENGYNSTTKKFEFDENNRKNLTSPTSPDYDPNVTVGILDYTEDGKKREKVDIEVTGFDFAANYVGVDPETGKCVGKKLQIEFDIKIIDGFAGGNKVPTNGPASGLYLSKSHTTPLMPYPRPSINRPVIDPEFEFDLQDISIYRGNTVTADQFLTISGISGIEYDYVKRNIYYRENETSPWQLVSDDKFNPTETKLYKKGTVMVEFEPIVKDIPEVSGVENPAPIGDLAEKVGRESKKDFTIYVLQPKVAVTLNDIGRYYGENYTLGSFEDSEKPEITVTWKEPDNPNMTASDKTGVEKTFDKDDIKLAYSADGYKGTVTKKDIIVSVTPQFNKTIECLGVSETDAVSKLVTPTVTTSCGLDVGCASSRTDSTYKIHSKHTTLDIVSNGGKVGDTHSYNILKDGSLYTTVTLGSNSTAKLTELPVGIYKVVPVDEWSWRDTSSFKDTIDTAVLTPSNTSGTITINHVFDGSKTIGTFSEIVSNIFGVSNN